MSSKDTNNEKLSEAFDDLSEFITKLLDEAYEKGYADGLKAKGDSDNEG